MDLNISPVKKRLFYSFPAREAFRPVPGFCNPAPEPTAICPEFTGALTLYQYPIISLGKGEADD